MRILQLKKMYFPALTIVAIVILLLVIIGISTQRNLDREEKRTLDFVHRQGLALLRSLEAGTRAGMITHMWDEDAVRSLILETAKSEDIAYIYFYDEGGFIIHHSDPSQDGKRMDLHLEFADEYQVINRVRKLEYGSTVYEIAKRFSPYLISALPKHHLMMDRGHMMTLHVHPNAIVVLGLRMTSFEEARQADRSHALIMAGILLALGTGALFFVFVIQNYYLVDKTLQETQDYTAQVVSNMANGLLSIDANGRVASYNRMAIELLNLEESEVSGMDLNETIDFEASGIRNTLSTCEPVFDREIYHRSSAGETVPLAVSVTPIVSDEDECRGAVIILRDLREIKELEGEVRRSEKLAAVGELAAGVAHEIRNPLSSIRGFAQFLRHALADRPKDREYAEIMVKEVDRMNKVVTDLLTFARPLEAEMASTDLEELIEHTARLIRADAEAHGVEIHKKISPGLGAIKVDANQITQALLNLMLNSVQAMGEGGNLEVGAAFDGSDSHLQLWVEDDGPGIPPEHKDKIFDPFFTSREKGTGLGLAIVHSIVEHHRGEVRVESPLRGDTRGCRFTISIPVDSSELYSPESGET
jgi:two-component system sensor histidine kinase HydH